MYNSLDLYLFFPSYFSFSSNDYLSLELPISLLNFNKPGNNFLKLDTRRNAW